MNKVWKKFEKLLTKKTSDLIGIDIGTGAIKLVEIAWQKDKAVLKNFAIKELPDHIIEEGHIIDRQQLTELLRQLLANTRIISKNAVIAMGGRAIFARELIFPAMKIEELKEAIKWDLEKYIPYPPDTYYYDFSIVGQGNTATEIKVLLVASPMDNVNAMISMIKEVGLKLVAIDIEPLAFYRIFDNADKAMVIDIGAYLSQVVVFQNDSPAVIRNIPIGGQNFTQIFMQTLGLDDQEGEKLKKTELILLRDPAPAEYTELQAQLEYLVAEFTRDIRRTAEYFQQQNRDVIIDKVLITGGGANLGNLVEYLSSHLNAPVLIHDPLAKLKIPSIFDKKHLQQVAPQLATAIGLALRGGDE